MVIVSRVVGTLKTVFITADGETYNITVNYTAEAEIPEGSELIVREILPGSAEYEDYKAKTSDALGLNDVPTVEFEETELTDTEAEPYRYIIEENGKPELTFLRLFDISIVYEGVEIEPKVPVEVIITYVEPMNTNDGSSLNVLHFADEGTEIIEEFFANSTGTQIIYEASSFSVYGTARSNVGSGDYIIYYDGNNNNDYALNYNNGDLGRQSVSIGGGRVTSNSDNARIRGGELNEITFRLVKTDQRIQEIQEIIQKYTENGELPGTQGRDRMANGSSGNASRKERRTEKALARLSAELNELNSTREKDVIRKAELSLHCARIHEAVELSDAVSGRRAETVKKTEIPPATPWRISMYAPAAHCRRVRSGDTAKSWSSALSKRSSSANPALPSASKPA